MTKVFISYRHTAPDEEIATGLAGYLEARGCSVFVDKKIAVGREWVEEIERELRAARHFVVFLSADSIRSDMVRREVALAHELRQAKHLRVYPVRVCFTGALPYDLAAYLDPVQHIRWNSRNDDDFLRHSILQEIGVGPLNDSAVTFAPGPDDLRLLAEATEFRGAPLPAADPRLDTGAVGLDSPFYVRRREDGTAISLLTQYGATVLVKGSRQVGKTSLLARAQASARKCGQKVVYLDFQLVDEGYLESSHGILRYLAEHLAEQLRTPMQPDEVWSPARAPQSLTNFIEQGVLSIDGLRLCFVLDEVDRIFQYPIKNTFFATIRAWHNRRAINPDWNRVNLAIGHSTEPALFIDDLNQSPFNVGEVLRLGDFTTAQVEWLNERHGRPLCDESEIAKLIELVGGHPYLMRQALYVLRTTLHSLAALERSAVDDNGPFGDHLRRHLWSLRNREPLRNALKQVLGQRRCGEVEFERLRSAGLLAGESHHEARFRCDLYRRYFAKRL